MSVAVRTGCTECGWVGGPYRSPAQADYAFRQHSCEKARRSHAAYELSLAREAAIDRTPKVCRHPRAHHEHGTYAAYTLDRCRCLPCAAAASRYGSELARDHAYGRSRLVDAEPVRQHVQMLSEHNVGLKRITALTGVSGGTLSKLMYGTPRPDGTRRPPALRMGRGTAEKILAVQPVQQAPAARVDPTGTTRRLQALIALGWSVQRLADEHGLDRQRLDRALAGAPVHAATAEAVRTMFDAIGDARPPATTSAQRTSISRSLRRAQAHRWLPPAYWDEGDLDDPYAAPPNEQSAPCDQRPARRSTLDLAEWLWLVNAGENPERAAQRCGVSIDGVQMAIRRGDPGHEDAALALRGAAA